MEGAWDAPVCTAGEGGAALCCICHCWKPSVSERRAPCVEQTCIQLLMTTWGIGDGCMTQDPEEKLILCPFAQLSYSHFSVMQHCPSNACRRASFCSLKWAKALLLIDFCNEVLSMMPGLCLLDACALLSCLPQQGIPLLNLHIVWRHSTLSLSHALYFQVSQKPVGLPLESEQLFSKRLL